MRQELPQARERIRLGRRHAPEQEREGADRGHHVHRAASRDEDGDEHEERPRRHQPGRGELGCEQIEEGAEMRHAVGEHVPARPKRERTVEVVIGMRSEEGPRPHEPRRGDDRRRCERHDAITGDALRQQEPEDDRHAEQCVARVNDHPQAQDAERERFDGPGKSWHDEKRDAGHREEPGCRPRRHRRHEERVVPGQQHRRNERGGGEDPMGAPPRGDRKKRPAGDREEPHHDGEPDPEIEPESHGARRAEALRECCRTTGRRSRAVAPGATPTPAPSTRATWRRRSSPSVPATRPGPAGSRRRPRLHPAAPTA